jgi:malonate-semialdehyde dehydrogenase (acetylating)/methylmalonate-semialdehyde dehydrogenase
MVNPRVTMLKKPITVQHLVGGEWIFRGTATKTLNSPYHGEKIGEMLVAQASDVDLCVKKAGEAWPLWRKTPIKERATILFKFRELMLRDIDETANLAALEAGKTFDEAKAGILKGLEVTEFALSLQNIPLGGALEVSRGVFCQTERVPLGVVVGVTPFNFPAMVPLWMIPIALAAGNAFILKPSDKVPLTAQRIGDCLMRAGLPKGIFSIINGDAQTVTQLITHADVKAVGFVGSTAVAKRVYELATSHHKRALCLGGAKNLLILAPDAEPQMTVRGVVDSFTGCAGQRCMAASLLVAVGDCDSLIQKIIAEAKKISLGLDMGAIIDKTSLSRMTDIIDRAEKAGAKIVLDGRNPKRPEGCDLGNWLAPTIIDHANPGMECANTEIFGPVLTIVRVKSLSEALEIDRLNAYGNATSIFTQSGAVARMVADESASGMIGINIGVPVPREPFSFGGAKQSKFGALDITGMGGLEFWTELKKITSKWSQQGQLNWMS